MASAAAPLGATARSIAHVAVNATYYERSPASKHYCVQTIEATKLVDTEVKAILDVHCITTREGSDAEGGMRRAVRAVQFRKTRLDMCSLERSEFMYKLSP